MRDQLALLPEYLTAHLRLSLAAVLLGASFSLPVGVWLTRHRRFEPGVMGVASVIQTIPSLALLAFMVPALALAGAYTTRAFGIEIRSIGTLPALIALTLYGVLPLLRNTVTGIAAVDPSIIEAAHGVGMTGRERLWRVELPLAAPVIVAGLRTATVWVVGMATLSTPVGATSLGNYIFSGLQTRNFAAVLVGCVAAASLALVLDGLIRALEKGVRERRPKLTRAAVALLGALALSTLLSFAGGRESGRVVRIGAKTFTEQYILAEILARHLEGRTGLQARALHSLGSTVAFDALASGALDVYVDYSGTLWATILGRAGTGESRERVIEEVSTHLAREHGITTVGPLGFENAYALAMRGADARKLGISSLGQLAPRAPELSIASDYEFFSRPEWAALERIYGFSFRERRSMDPSLMYQAIADGQVDVISAYSTDGRIAALDLAVLEDDRRAIPPYDALILVRSALSREAPEVARALSELVGAIDAGAMRRMNFEVDEKGRSAAAVAVEFLANQPRAASS